MRPTDPLAEPFYLAYLAYNESVKARVAQLTDDELEQVRDMFGHHNYRNIPSEFWLVAAKVRAACTVEQRRRAAAHRSEAVPA